MGYQHYKLLNSRKKKQYSQDISKNTKGLSHQKNIGKPASRLTSTHKRSKAYQQLLKISSNKMKNIVYNSVTPREYFYNRFQRKCELILSFSKQSNEEVQSIAYESYLSNIQFNVESIFNTSDNLDQNKTHGPDNAGIRMLYVFYKRNDDKQNFKTYRAFFLCPVLGKKF